ncbi:MAG: hypothetical protein HY313_11345 [Acidobacteria bacterium]|nr:hypothetical protein [Acidobacteriota bacterium]
MSTAQTLPWEEEIEEKNPQWNEPKEGSSKRGKFLTESPSNILLKAEIEQAKRILELKDDWDGEGSAGYSEDTLNRAITFLITHAQWLWESCGISLPVPKIGPGPDGSIDIHWKQPSWELLVNIPADADEAATFYGDNYGAHKIRGSLDARNFNLGIATWLMN